MASVIILGSGTGVPLRTRSGPGWALILGTPQADAILVDPSAGSAGRLSANGIPFERLTHVLLTHFHPDHTGDLVPILFAYRNLGYPQGHPPLHLIGPQGLGKLLRDLRGVYGSWIEPPCAVRVTELAAPLAMPGGPPGGPEGPRSVRIGPFDVSPFPVVHASPSVAYRFEARGGPTLAYTGDTDVCDGAVTAARNADILLIECSFPEGQKRSGHLVPSEAAGIAAAAGARRAVLLHRYPECDGQDLVAPFRERFGGEVIVAEDGLVLEL
jgi:ribonuclease BN (tRNA processing enzyme)